MVFYSSLLNWRKLQNNSFLRSNNTNEVVKKTENKQGCLRMRKNLDECDQQTSTWKNWPIFIKVCRPPFPLHYSRAAVFFWKIHVTISASNLYNKQDVLSAKEPLPKKEKQNKEDGVSNDVAPLISILTRDLLNCILRFEIFRMIKVKLNCCYMPELT